MAAASSSDTREAQHRNWPRQFRHKEPARKGRQDDRHETDHGAIDHQARIAYHPGLEQPVADEKDGMSDGPGGDCRAHDFAAIRSADRAGVNDPERLRTEEVLREGEAAATADRDKRISDDIVEAAMRDGVEIPPRPPRRSSPFENVVDGLPTSAQRS